MAAMASPRRRSLAGRLLLTYAVAVLVVLGLMGFFVERSSRSALLGELEEGLTQQALTLADVLPDDAGDIVADVDQLAADLDARVTVIDPDGAVVADSLHDPADMENHADRPEVQAALSGQVGIDRRLSATTGFRQLYVAVRGANGRVVRLSLPENTVTARVTPFRSQLLLIVALAGLFGILVVALVARFLARPLVRLADAASGLAEGNLDIDPPRSSVAELDRLGRSLRTVAEELGSRLAEVEGERRTLGVVLDALPQGTLLLDRGGDVLYANRSLEALLGPVPVHLDQVVPFRVQEMVRRAVAEGRVVDQDMEHGRPPRILRVIASPFEDDRVLVVVSDVTDRRRVDDVRRDFVTNASHELKTPVASILASSEALEMALERAPDRAVQFAQQIGSSARSLARLVADLLDLSRLESREGDREEVALAETVTTEVERVAELAERRGVSLRAETSDVEVLGSAADLALAVRNLLDNAVRYTDEGGEVVARVERQGDDAVLSVTDTGAGISQRDLERIFERFYRVDVARSWATGGTGLGLSIVRHVVEAHGGTLGVVSELGVGSTFTVRLPALG